MEDVQFYAVLIIIALIILIGSLVFIGMKMNSTTYIAPYPPIALACPDYWMTDSSGNCVADTVNLGGFPSGYTFNPNTIKAIGLTQICAQQQFAKNNNIIWTGVTEYNQCKL